MLKQVLVLEKEILIAKSISIETRLAELTAGRDEPIATGTDRVATVARQLCTLRAVAGT